MQSQEQAPSFWEKNRILIKGLLTGFLILIMLIPAAILDDLVIERGKPPGRGHQRDQQ